MNFKTYELSNLFIEWQEIVDDKKYELCFWPNDLEAEIFYNRREERLVSESIPINWIFT